VIGILTPQRPLLPLPFPLPYVGAVKAVRLGAVIVSRSKLQDFVGSNVVANPIQLPTVKIANRTPAEASAT